MIRWFRVFGRTNVPPAPAALAEELRRLHADATAHFRGDDLGWFAAELILDPDTPPVRVERFLTKEDDIRGELNTWAAWLESAGESPTHVRSMQDVIGTMQLFVFHPSLDDEADADPLVERLCVELSQFLARQTAGIYQVDGAGFFAADGTLLVSEE